MKLYPPMPPPPPELIRPTLADLRQAYQTLDLVMNQTQCRSDVFLHLRETLRELAVQIVQRTR